MSDKHVTAQRETAQTPITAEDIAFRFPDARRSGHGWLVPCPCHADDNPSCSVFDGKDGVKVECYAGCDWRDVRRELGLDRRTNGGDVNWREQYRIATYQHPDGRAVPRYRKNYPADFPPGPCTWYHKDKNGNKKLCGQTAPHKHIWGPSVRGCYVLAWGEDAPGNTAIICEGEKAAAACAQHMKGMPYTAFSYGGTSATSADFSPLNGRKVIIWPDNDDASAKATVKIGQKLAEVGAQILLMGVAGLNRKDDAADVDKETALKLIAGAKEYEPPAASHGGAREGAGRQERIYPVLWLMFTEKGFPQRSSIANVGVALESFSDCGFSYDEFADEELLNGERIDDSTAGELWHRMEIELEFGPTKDALYAGIARACRLNSFHPVKDYLDGLEWDGRRRLARLGATHFGAEDTPLQNAIARLILYGMVARIEQPGAKYDYMPILQSGKQGLAKSEALRLLAGKWAGSGLSLDSFDLPKTLIERTRGKWLIECADLGGWKGSDIEKVKGIVSDRSDSARMAYGRKNVTRDRQFILVGTANPREFLKDSQNRRFPVLEVVRPIALDVIKRDRDQLLAEALRDMNHFEEDGDLHVTLPPALWEEAETHSQQFRVVSAFEEWFSGWAEDGVSRKTDFLSKDCREAMQDAGLDKVNNQEYGRVINAAGYRRKRRSNKVVWILEG